MKKVILFADIEGRSSVLAENVLRGLTFAKTSSGVQDSGCILTPTPSTILNPAALVLSRYLVYALPPSPPIRSQALVDALSSLFPTSKPELCGLSIGVLTRKKIEATDIILTPYPKQRDLVRALCPSAGGKCYTLNELVGMEELAEPFASPPPEMKLYGNYGNVDHSLQAFLKQGLREYLELAIAGTVVAIEYKDSYDWLMGTYYLEVLDPSPLTLRIDKRYPSDKKSYTLFEKITIDQIVEMGPFHMSNYSARIAPKKCQLSGGMGNDLKSIIQYRNTLLGQMIKLAQIPGSFQPPSTSLSPEALALKEHIAQLEHTLGSIPSLTAVRNAEKTIASLASDYLAGKPISSATSKDKNPYHANN